MNKHLYFYIPYIIESMITPLTSKDTKYTYPILEMGNTVLLLLLLQLLRHAQGTPTPLTLLRAGLESSGQRLISSIGKT